MLEKVKKLGFYFQNEAGKLWRYASESLIIDSKLFFDKLLENFPCIVRGCLIYLKGVPDIACYAKKKELGTYDIPMIKYRPKCEKNPVFCELSLEPLYLLMDDF